MGSNWLKVIGYTAITMWLHLAASAQTLPTGGAFSYVGEVTQSLLMSSWAAMGVGVADSSGGEAMYVTAGMWCNAHNAFVAQIDPDTHSLLVATYLIPGSGENTIWGTTMGKDSALYLSVKESENIYRFDLRSKVFTNLGNPPFPMCANAAYAMTTDAAGKVYMASYAGIVGCGIHLGMYDPDLQIMTYLGMVDTENRYPHTMATTATDLYIAVSTEKRKLFRYNFANQSFTQILNPSDCCAPGYCDVGYNDFGALVVRLEDNGNGQQKYCFLDTLTDSLIACVAVATPLYTSQWPRLADGRRLCVNGPDMRLNIKYLNNSVTAHPISSPLSSSCAYTMTTGGDGNIYSGVQPLQMVRINPQNDSITHLGNPTGTTGEINSMISRDSLLWMANYPNGNLSVLNFNLPYALVNGRAGPGPNDNPRSLGNVQNYQERPFDIAIGQDDNLYMAFKADYGSSTGSITRFDRDSASFTVFQPYTGKAIHGLENVGNELWAASEELLFQWDYSNGTVVYDTLAPCAAGKHTRLVFCPANQTLYGVCNQQDRLFYAFDPQSRQFLSQTVLDSCDNGLSAHFNRLSLGLDGLVYGHCPNSSRKKSYLFVVNPQTHQPQFIGTWDAGPTGITGGHLWNGLAFHANDIYLPSGSHIVKFTKSYPVSVTENAPNALKAKLYPNPAHTQLLAHILSPEDGTFVWRITDVNGKEQLSGQSDVVNGSSKSAIDIDSLHGGIYFFTIVGNGTSITLRFLVI